MSETPAEPPPEVPPPPQDSHELTVDADEPIAYSGGVVYRRRPDGSLELT